jgi:hypothetical protein
VSLTIPIKSGSDRDLDLHFHSSDDGGNEKSGTLHITICAMQRRSGQDVPVRSLSCELDHADIDKLIQELQAAKGLLVSNEPDKMGSVSNIPDMDAVCSQCGWKWGEHACNGACIERLPDNMMRFSKTERFTE